MFNVQTLLAEVSRRARRDHDSVTALREHLTRVLCQRAGKTGSGCMTWTSQLKGDDVVTFFDSVEGVNPELMRALHASPQFYRAKTLVLKTGHILVCLVFNKTSAERTKGFDFSAEKYSQGLSFVLFPIKDDERDGVKDKMVFWANYGLPIMSTASHLDEDDVVDGDASAPVDTVVCSITSAEDGNNVRLSLLQKEDGALGFISMVQLPDGTFLAIIQSKNDMTFGIGSTPEEAINTTKRTTNFLAAFVDTIHTMAPHARDVLIEAAKCTPVMVEVDTGGHVVPMSRPIVVTGLVYGLHDFRAPDTIPDFAAAGLLVSADVLAEGSPVEVAAKYMERRHHLRNVGHEGYVIRVDELDSLSCEILKTKLIKYKSTHFIILRSLREAMCRLYSTNGSIDIEQLQRVLTRSESRAASQLRPFGVTLHEIRQKMMDNLAVFRPFLASGLPPQSFVGFASTIGMSGMMEILRDSTSGEVDCAAEPIISRVPTIPQGAFVAYILPDEKHITVTYGNGTNVFPNHLPRVHLFTMTPVKGTGDFDGFSGFIVRDVLEGVKPHLHATGEVPEGHKPYEFNALLESRSFEVTGENVEMDGILCLYFDPQNPLFEGHMCVPIMPPKRRVFVCTMGAQASGKSTTTGLLKEMGVHGLVSDDLVHERIPEFPFGQEMVGKIPANIKRFFIIREKFHASDEVYFDSCLHTRNMIEMVNMIVGITGAELHVLVHDTHGVIFSGVRINEHAPVVKVLLERHIARCKEDSERKAKCKRSGLPFRPSTTLSSNEPIAKRVIVETLNLLAGISPSDLAGQIHFV